MLLSFRQMLVCLLFFVMSSCVKEEVRIGYLAGLSGPSSEQGSMGRKALDMAITEANAQESLQNRLFRLIVADDKNYCLDAVKAFHYLKERNVHLVIGPITSGILGSIFPFINEHQLIFISPTANAMRFSGKNDYFYRVITSNKQVGQFLAHCVLRQGIRRIAVLQEVLNVYYTQGILDSFQEKIQNSDVKISLIVRYDTTHDKDYLTTLTQQLIQGGPDAFLLLTNSFESALFSQELAKAGHMQPVFLSPWAMSHDLIELGGKQTSRIYLVGALDPQSKNISYLNFKKKVQELYNKDPDFASVFVWDAFTVVLSALENTDLRKPGELKRNLDILKPLDGLQSPIIFDNNGDVDRELFLLRIQDGSFMRVDP